MSLTLPDITFVVNKSGDPAVFKNNFAASPVLNLIPPGRVIVQEGLRSAALGYNDAIDKAKTDLIAFSHQDVYYPKQWLSDLAKAIAKLDVSDPNWGVLGCWGNNTQGLEAGYLYSVGLGILGEPFEKPIEIETLDEYVLILRKSSGLRFDNNLPGFHFYGTDICMTAHETGKKCYAISAFAVHNTSYGPLSKDFFACYWPVRKKWQKNLPIQTSCIRITQWNEDFIKRRLKERIFRVLGRDMTLKPRIPDPSAVLKNK
jgi:Glycosyltransferase like family